MFSLSVYNLNNFNRRYNFKYYGVIVKALATYLFLYSCNKGITHHTEDGRNAGRNMLMRILRIK